MYRAILAGEDYPPAGVADTPENRATWDRIVAELEAMPAGVIPQVPWDWSDMPDE